MKNEDFTKVAMDNHSFLCYIVDIKTFELLYINENARRTFSPFLKSFRPGKKCYDFLHARSAPCSDCNVHILKQGKKLCSEIQNERNNRFYTHIDTKIEMPNRTLKLTYAYETSDCQLEINSHSRVATNEETLLRCIETLVQEGDLDDAVLKLLSIVCDYYEADRAYIFKVFQEQRIAKNIYEWSISPELQTINKYPYILSEELEPILAAFEEDGGLVIEDIHRELGDSNQLFQFLHATNSHTIQLAPVYSTDGITYFMGVDNPTRYIKDLSLLHSVLIFVTDAIKKHKTLKQLEFLSYTDVLTGLMNRNKYLERIEKLDLEKLSSLGYIHVNVNALKKQNELYGEKHGDTILKDVAKILSSYIPKDLYRVVGDEFVAFCKNISKADFDTLVFSLQEESLMHKNLSFAVGGVWQEKKIDIRKGLMQANDIMYSDKQKYYKNQVTENIQMRVNPVEILLNEIRSNLFSIYLQPKVDLLTGRISSAEALVRKINADGKIISPDRFIPIYENENTIRHLDFFVLEEVCQLQKKLIEENRALPIAVNFSRITFLAYTVIDEIVSICAEYKIPHMYIKIELTESVDKMDYEFFQKKISNLKSLGFDVSLDDFGAKQSNLLMLTMSEFSEVKIDKGLIDNITTSSENRTVVRNIIKTIKELGKSHCVAEGIETEEQMKLLQDLGCNTGQGYFFYKPMPVSGFLAAYTDNISEQAAKRNIIENKAKLDYTINYDELYAIIDGIPLCISVWDHTGTLITCNAQTPKLFGFETKEEYQQQYNVLCPEFQPNGENSIAFGKEYLNKAWESGSEKFNWLYKTTTGVEIPTEITLVKLDIKSDKGNYLIAGYTRDLRTQISGEDELAISKFFLKGVNERVLMNAISDISSEFYWVYDNKEEKIQFFGKSNEILGLPLEKMDFPKKILEKNIVPEEYKNEFMEFVKAMEEGEYKPIAVKFNRPDGTKQQFKVDYTLIRDNENKPLYSIGKTTSMDESVDDVIEAS